MRGVVRRAAPPFPAVLNKFIFKGSRGGFVVLVPQGPENVLRPGLICRRRQKFFQKHKIRVAMANALSPTSPSPTPRAQDQVATLPLSGSFRCFELPFSRRGWPWCCIKFLFRGVRLLRLFDGARRVGARVVDLRLVMVGSASFLSEMHVRRRLPGRGHPPHRPEKNRRPPRRVLSQGAEAPHSPQSLRTQAATRAAPQEHVQRTPEADGRGTQGRAPGTRRVRAQALAGRVRQPGPPREMRRRVVHHGPTRRRLHGQRAAVLARVRPEVDGGEWLRARPAADGRSMREPLPVPLLA
mmetsp:Transcript_9767/g.28776  ORF Transcript_9767/g.28776 Transcript_9767/m.28776 type:complete len:297 (-) Transcript_9767:36-926(-)